MAGIVWESKGYGYALSLDPRWDVPNADYKADIAAIKRDTRFSSVTELTIGGFITPFNSRAISYLIMHSNLRVVTIADNGNSEQVLWSLAEWSRTIRYWPRTIVAVEERKPHTTSKMLALLQGRIVYKSYAEYTAAVESERRAKVDLSRTLSSSTEIPIPKGRKFEIKVRECSRMFDGFDQSMIEENKSKAKPNRKKSEDRVTNVPISLTGVRVAEDEFLIGCTNRMKGVVLGYSGPDIPPSCYALKSLMEFPDLYEEFLTKLSAIPRFKRLSLASRDDYLWKTVHGGTKQLHQFQRREAIVELDETDHRIIRNVERGLPWDDGLTEYKSSIKGHTRDVPGLDSQDPNDMKDEDEPDNRSSDEIFITIIDRGDKKSVFGEIPDEVIAKWEADYPNGKIPINRVAGALRKEDTGKVSGLDLYHFTIVPDRSADVPINFEGLSFKVGTSAGSNQLMEFEAFKTTQYEGFLIDDDRSKENPRIRLVAIADKRKPRNPLQNDEAMIQIIASVYGGNSRDIKPAFTDIKSWIVNADHARFALRQLISLSPNVVQSPNKTGTNYPAGLVGLCVQAALMMKARVYNRRTRRTESGLEMYAVEMANTTMKRSYTDKVEIVSQLLVCALIKRKVRSWYPTEEVISGWLRFGLDVQMNVSKRYRYDPRPYTDSKKKGAKLKYNDLPPIAISSTQNLYQTAAALADVVGVSKELSHVYKAIAKRKPEEHIRSNLYSDVKGEDDADFKLVQELEDDEELEPYRHLGIMPWTLTVHTSWAPAMVFFMEYESITHARNFDSPTAPFAVLIRKIDETVTGINPRMNRATDLSFSDPFQKSVLSAQKLYWNAAVAKRAAPVPFAEGEMDHTVNFVNTFVHPSWLAGGVGVMEVQGLINAQAVPLVVTMNPQNLLELSVSHPISAAKEGKKEKETDQSRKIRLSVPAESRALAITDALEKLKYGVKWSGNTPPVPAWADMKITRVGSRYLLGGVDWDVRRAEPEPIPMFEAIGTDWKSPPVFKTYGCLGDAFIWIKRQIESDLPVDVVRRILTYLEDKRTRIAMPTLDSHGIGHSIIEDAGVFQFFLSMCHQIPHAIAFESDLSFKVKYAPVLFQLRALVVARIRPAVGRGFSPEGFVQAWGEMKDSLNRPLFADQEEAIQENTDKHLAGNRGDMLWRPPGSGKTLICIYNLINRIKEAKGLPTRVFHFGPSSSIESVYNEYVAMGFKVFMLNAIRRPATPGVYTWNANVALPKYSVFMIQHLDMRLDGITGTLTPAILADSFCLFDEYHELMDETRQKSQWARTYMELCGEFIALTGTAAKDANALKNLIPVLSLVSQFQVTPENYQTAVNSITHQEVEPPAIDVDIEFPAELTAEEEEWWNKNMSEKYGGLSKAEPTSEQKDRAKRILNDAMDRAVVRKTLAILKDEREQPGTLLRARGANVRNMYFKQLVAAGVDPKKIVLVGTLFTPETPAEDKPLLNQAVSRKRIDFRFSSKDAPDALVVIIPMIMSTGYNATRYRNSVDKPEEINVNSHTQWRMRINRYDQPSEKVYHWTPMDTKGRARKLLERYTFPQNVNAIVSNAILSRGKDAKSDVKASPPPRAAAAAAASSSSAAAAAASSDDSQEFRRRAPAPSPRFAQSHAIEAPRRVGFTSSPEVIEIDSD